MGGRLPLAARLFLTCWVVYSLHFATNVVREHYPAFSLAERGTLRVDPYMGLHPDLFEIEGRGAFINNNPGASMLAAIPYALTRPLVDGVVARVAAARAERGAELSSDYADHRPNRREFFRKVREQGLDVRFGLACGLIQVLFTAPLSALSVVVMNAVLRRTGFPVRAALGLSLVYAFGTPLFFRSGYLNHNLLVAHFALFAFALLYRPGGIHREPGRLVAAGLCLGTCILCDYSGIVPVLAIGIWSLSKLSAEAGPRAGVRRELAIAGAAALPVAALLAYQGWAFGNPFLPAQRYMPATPYSVHGWNGLNWPAPDLLASNLLDPAYGILAFGPILALGLAAPLLARRGACRLGNAELGLCLGLFAGIWVFTSMNEFARLQWNTGFRMLAPAVPFLFLASACVLERLPRAVAWALGALAILQGWCLAMVREDVPTSLGAVLRDGPQLPWLTVLWKMGDQYLAVLEQTGPQAWPLFALTALVLLVLWWPLRLEDTA